MIRDSLASLSKRERLVLAAGVGVLLLAAIFLAAESIGDRLERSRTEVASKEALLAWMEEAAGEVAALRAAGRRPAGAATGSPLAVIERTARQFKLQNALKRVEPAEQNAVRVWLDDAVFDDLLRWLQLLQRNNGIDVVTLSIERRELSGYVNAKITLKAGE